MKNLYLLFILFSLSGFLFSCSNTEATVAEEEAPEAIIENIMAEEDIMANIDSTAISAEDKETLAAVQEERKEAMKENIEKSVLKEKSCEEIFEEYKTVAEEYLATQDAKVLLKLEAWTNDVIYMSCRKKEPYATQFTALRAKVDAVGEEDEEEVW